MPEFDIEEYKTARRLVGKATKEEVTALVMANREDGAKQAKANVAKVHDAAPGTKFRTLAKVVVETDSVIRPIIAGVGSLKIEFDTLGEYICACDKRLTYIRGPIKKSLKALGKTVRDNKLDWALNKDLVRGTIAADDIDALGVAVAEIKAICKEEFGMALTKADPVPPNACGYSGWNFNVAFEGQPLVAELQANTVAMLYGKHSKFGLLEDNVFSSAKEYETFEKMAGFQGALGHALYDFWQEDKKGADGVAAAALAKRYHDVCRMVKGPGAQLQLLKKEVMGLNVQLENFENVLTGKEAKKTWAEYKDRARSAKERW